MSDDVKKLRKEFECGHLGDSDINSEFLGLVGGALEYIEALEAENKRLRNSAKSRLTEPPTHIGGDVEFPFAIEWHDGDDCCALVMECGEVEFTWFKGTALHSERTWKDPAVEALRAENKRLRIAVTRMLADAQYDGPSNVYYVEIEDMDAMEDALRSPEGGVA